jgi:hypothetical protein
MKINENNVKKIEEHFDKNPIEHINQLKKCFDECRLEAVEYVNFQLNKFRQVHQIGKKFLFNSV